MNGENISLDSLDIVLEKPLNGHKELSKYTRSIW